MTWILRTKVISKWGQHRDESIASICQGENAEIVEHVRCVGVGREQPINVLFVNALREEGEDSEKLFCVGAELLEHRGGERKFDRGGQAPRVPCVKYACSPFPPFTGQSVGISTVVLSNSSE